MNGVKELDAVNIHNIGKKYKNGVQALESITFTIKKGEFVSIIGASGAGKTTLMRMLNGAIRPDSGEVLLGAKGSLYTMNKKQRRSVQASIGTIYQDFCLVTNLTCLQNVLNADIPHMPFVRVLLGIFTQQQKDRALQALEITGLKDKADIPASQLSGGQKQRVAIARAIMQNPQLLLADEPVASLDPYTAVQIMDILKHLQIEMGITVIMNSHNVELSMQYSDRLIGIRKGRVVLDKLVAETSETEIRNVYGAESSENHEEK